MQAQVLFCWMLCAYGFKDAHVRQNGRCRLSLLYSNLYSSADDKRRRSVVVNEQQSKERSQQSTCANGYEHPLTSPVCATLSSNELKSSKIVKRLTHRRLCGYTSVNPCTGYLAHPFEKKAHLAAFASLFLAVSGTRPSIQEGNCSRSEEKTPVYGQ